MVEEQEKKISKYNSGVAIQIRLDSLWTDANNHSRRGDYLAWNNDLDAVWRELARDISDKDWEKKKQTFEKYDSKISNIDSSVFEPPLGFKKPDKELWKKRDELYKIIMDKELFLKRLENEYGKGTAVQNEEDFDFE